MNRKHNKIITILSFLILFISKPVVAASFIENLSNSYIFLGIILLLGFLGFVIEIFNSNFGLGTLISIFSFAAFFILNSGNLMAGSYVPYFVVGLILLIIEIIIPGFTFTGILGIVLISLSIIQTVDNPVYGIIMLISVLIIVVGVVIYLFRKGYSSKFLNKLILKSTHDVELQEKRNVNKYLKYEGEKGIVLTDMRPSGMIEIGDVKLDAISEGVYIKKGEKVIVTKVEGNKITVRRM